MRHPARSLRVLMSTDTVGGVWMYAMELAGALRGHGVQVVLATMGAAPSEDQRRRAAQIPDLVLCEGPYQLEWMERPWSDVDRAGRWLLGLERRYCPEVVHLNHYAHGHLDWRAPHLVVGHSCVWSWWHAVLKAAPPPCRHTYRRRVRRGLRGARAVVAPSAAMLQALQRHYGPIDTATVIHNGRIPGAYRRGPKRPYILAVGRVWDAAKNLVCLTRIAPTLRWPVHLAGEPRHPEGGVASMPHVNLLGQLTPDALCRWYAGAAIYALPARYEPFGLSVLEAALSGCAPVIGDIDSLRELWDGAACFVDPDDPDALRCALDGLAGDPDRRRDIARRAAERARRYTTARMAGAYLALYDDLLSGQLPEVRAQAITLR